MCVLSSGWCTTDTTSPSPTPAPASLPSLATTHDGGVVGVGRGWGAEEGGEGGLLLIEANYGLMGGCWCRVWVGEVYMTDVCVSL